jgi:predicted nuclease of restriction endonuclease-like (RecB) superfamily
VRILQRQVDSMLFERIALSKDKAWVLGLAQSWITADSPQDLIKDPYIFEFLNLPDLDEFHESDLEQQLINHLQKFLLELGDGFSFVARQKTIMMDGDRYYIDLVFYHRML